MALNSTQTDLKAFYDRWKGRIFLFCRLCVGEGEVAEGALREIFLAHFREDGGLSLDRLPLDLLRRAADAVASAAIKFTHPREPPSNVPGAILHLPWPHRMAFVLKHVFGLSSKETAFVARLSPQEINAVSFGAMLAIREMLTQKDYQEEQCT